MEGVPRVLWNIVTIGVLVLCNSSFHPFLSYGVSP